MHSQFSGPAGWKPKIDQSDSRGLSEFPNLYGNLTWSRKSTLQARPGGIHVQSVSQCQDQSAGFAVCITLALLMAEETHERLVLARGQLDTALDLFLDHKNYSSAITLAGAAEEIFGKALTLGGRKSALDSSYESMTVFHRMLHGTELDKTSYVGKENSARNALKHLQNDRGPTITIDLEDAACWMLVRAIQNGRELGYEFVRFQDFENWFHENVVGI